MSTGTKPAARPGFLPWRDFTELHLHRLNECSSAQELRNCLEDTLDLRLRYDEVADPSNSRRRAVFLDLAVSVLSFCRGLHFSPLKTSTLFSIVCTLHRAAAERDGAPPSLERCYGLFEELLLKHSVERPPFSIEVFTYADVRAITAFITQSYFRHLKLYQYMFGTATELVIEPKHSAAELPLIHTVPLLPLSAAISVEEPDAVPAEHSNTAKAPEVEVIHPANEPSNVTSPSPADDLLAAGLAELRLEFELKLKEQQEAFAQKLAAMQAGQGSTKRTSNGAARS